MAPKEDTNPRFLGALAGEQGPSNGAGLVHQLDKKVAVLETKMGYIADEITECNQSINRLTDHTERLDSKLIQIQGAISAIPRIEEALNKTLSKASEVEKQGISGDVKIKIIWGILTAVGIALSAALTRIILKA